MFLVVGSHTSDAVVSGHSKWLSCVHCGQQGMDGSVHREYVHILFIPLIPAGRTAVVTCPHCNSRWEEPMMPDQYTLEMAELRKKARTPWYHWLGFAGIIAVPLFVIWLVWNNPPPASSDKLPKNKYTYYGYIYQLPKKGDVLVLARKQTVEDFSPCYDLYKVDSVENTVLWTRRSRFFVNDAFSAEQYITGMLPLPEKGALYDNRKYYMIDSQKLEDLNSFDYFPAFIRFPKGIAFSDSAPVHAIKINVDSVSDSLRNIARKH